MRRTVRSALAAASDGAHRVLMLLSCLSPGLVSAAPLRQIDPPLAFGRSTGIDIAECGLEAVKGGLAAMPELPTTDELLARVVRGKGDAPPPILLAAAVVPGSRDAEPAAGPVPENPMRTRNNGQLQNGNGAQAERVTRWQLAPIRFGGNVSLDGRWTRSDDSQGSRQSLLATSVDAASYLWQPWFIQLRAGMGAILSRGSSETAYEMRRSDASTAWTGRLGVQVFPASRFPFEFRADVTDSRTATDFVGTDYRSTRIGVSQSYRPPQGNENYNLSYDYSALSSTRLPEDTVQTVRGLFVKTVGSHSIELSGSDSLNQRGGSDDSSRISSLAARHGYRPSGAFSVDNLATFNDIRVRNAAADTDLASEIRQISSFLMWRPPYGDGLSARPNGTIVTGNLRLVDSQVLASSSSGSRRSADAALGLGYDINRNLRFGGGLSVSQQSIAAAGVTPEDSELTLTTESATLAYTPDSLILGPWRYAPTAALNASATQGAAGGARDTLGVQLGHGLARSWLGEQGGALSLNLSQSAGVTRDSQQSDPARTLSHAISVFRQFANAGMTQSYAGLSVSDSRSYGAVDASFQLINGQFTQRSQLTRSSSWSGNLTVQASRARVEAGVVDPLRGVSTGQTADQGWRRYTSGSLSYENFRVFDVPRLRFVALASANSQQLERRAEGDVDAPYERIDHLFETRFEYAIGRLDMRLVARTARVDARRVDSVLFRINRRFGTN